MNKRFLSLISLLLVVVMALAACGPKEPVTPDAPITAEGVLSNFLSFKEGEAVKSVNTATHLNDTLGELVGYASGYAVFFKETKDRFNNLTETYSIYSAEERKVAFTVTNTYVDEFGGDDEFGNTTYPEKVISGVYVLSNRDIPYFNVDWTLYTPIDKAIIEEENLYYSYTEENYSEFYDVTGKFIAKSAITDEGECIDGNDYCTVVSFGKTVAVFDNETYEVASTYDGDVEATPRLYDFMNDEYNYMLNLPSAGISPEVNPYLAATRSKIMVYDKEGNLVLHYVHGDDAVMRQVEVLESGDILIQNTIITEAIEYDFLFDGQKANLDTFILDVETGALTEIKDFGYTVNEVCFAEDILEDVDNVKFTENVRNIAYAKNVKEDKYYTIFFDNFGNVNFVFDGKLAYEKDAEENLHASQCTVLKDDRLLIEIESGVTKQAIIDNTGKVIAYLTDGYFVLEDYIVSINADNSINIYDFDMKLVDTMSKSWASNYTDENEYVNYITHIGNVMIFEAHSEYTNSDDETITRDYVIRVDIKRQDYSSTSDARVEGATGNEIDDVIIIKKESKDLSAPLYYVVNGKNRVVLTVSAYNCDVIYDEDGTVVMVFDGEEVYLLDNSGTDYEEKPDDQPDDGKDPAKDPEKDPEKDDEDNDEGGDE